MTKLSYKIVTIIIIFILVIFTAYLFFKQSEQDPTLFDTNHLLKETNPEGTPTTKPYPKNLSAKNSAAHNDIESIQKRKDATTIQSQQLYANVMKLEAALITKAANYEQLAVVIRNMKINSTNYPYVPAIIPLKPGTYKRISSHFGMRFHPIKKFNKMHFGMDISANTGIPVHVTADGVVAQASRHAAGYGTMVLVKHAFGFYTIYGHLSSFTVSAGQIVKRGVVIGYVGNTGLSTGPHLHYEIIKNGNRINPISFTDFAKKVFINTYGY
jgi:murein DD-endopeptidase MepM/ murein hydrolase activator NlpD